MRKPQQQNLVERPVESTERPGSRIGRPAGGSESQKRLNPPSIQLRVPLPLLLSATLLVLCCGELKKKAPAFIELVGESCHRRGSWVQFGALVLQGVAADTVS